MKKVSFAAAIAVAIAGSALAADTRPAPDFKGKDADGKEHSLADLKGKVVVLEFTNPGSPASGKGGCPFITGRYEKGAMQKVQEKVKSLGAEYLAVNSSHFNTAEDSKQIAQKMSVKVATLVDSDGTIGKAFGAKTTPHMFVIGKDGSIVYEGALNDNKTPDADKDADAKNYVVDAVAAALKGEAPAVTKTESYGCGIKYKQ
ncbi:MAG: redoxin domain-containing protein [Candidatus Sumerlaeaceae bacterium]